MTNAVRPAIVLADDDVDIRELVAMILGDVGYDTTTAATGREALEQCLAHPPALALLDVSMPGELNGLQVVEALRADPRTAGVPILLLTALAQEDDVARGLGTGADGYVVKPFDPEELIERIMALVPVTGG
jgi:DNA-binding response OmpR family regulator